MSGPRYRADSIEKRRIVRLDGLTLLFHRPSGITHILSVPAPEILEALGDEPADAAGIVSRLAARHDMADIAEAEPVVAARLSELEAAGLVERL